MASSAACSAAIDELELWVDCITVVGEPSLSLGKKRGVYTVT